MHMTQAVLSIMHNSSMQKDSHAAAGILVVRSNEWQYDSIHLANFAGYNIKYLYRPDRLLR